MQKNIKLLLIAVCLLAAASSCKTTQRAINQNTESNKTIITQMNDTFLNGNWVFTQIYELQIFEDSKIQPYINFELEEKRFSAKAGCNGMGGAVYVENDLIKFDDILSTRMLCEIMQFENALSKALQNVFSYTEEADGSLVWFDENKEVIAILKKVFIPKQ